MSPQKYPIGIETFSDIIEGGYAYADKTEVIYRLTQSGKYFFLSRPRRFGKSLMLSTMEAYYQGRKELFEGLWLGQAEGVNWTPRPVLRLNFITSKSTPEDVEVVINRHLKEWEAIYNVTDIENSLGQRFFNVIKKAYETAGQKVVVLIDEYDKVLVNTMHDSDLHEQMKKILKPVFSNLKGADSYIEFAILTGVSRFSKLSIFSDLNNLRDITLDKRFCTICGITEDELRHYFTPGIESFAAMQNTDFEGMMRILKFNYDGYHFSENCPDIYNPFSLINALDSQKIEHRWFESGTPTFLVEQIRNSDEDLETLLSPLTTGGMLSNMSITDNDLTNTLYQTGYLTIKDYNPDDDVYILGIPNHEVKIGLYRSLLPLYTGKDPSVNEMALIKLRRAIRAGEVDKFMEILKSYLAGIPYSLSNGKPEIYYENNLYLIFKMLGFNAQVETQTSEGRIDIALRTPGTVYIMELKLDGSAEEALRQIQDKHYALPIEIEGRPIVRIGINFSKETRTIDSWIME